MHGFLVWSVGIVAGALLLMVAAITTAQVSAEVASAAVQSDTVLSPAADTLLRSSPTVAVPTASASLLGRDEAARVLATSVASGQMSGNDRTYLAQKVAQRAGIPPDEAEKHIDTAFADAQRAAEKARKAAVLTALLTASALLISLAAAWYAAQRGGYDRDHNLWAGRTMVRRTTTSPLS